jgi:hypothetical protein
VQRIALVEALRIVLTLTHKLCARVLALLLRRLTALQLAAMNSPLEVVVVVAAAVTVVVAAMYRELATAMRYD